MKTPLKTGNRTYCIFSAHYLPYLGGVESYTDSLSRALVELGNRVIIVTSNTHHLEPIITKDSVTIVRLPCYGVLSARLPLPRRNKEYRELFAYLQNQSVDYLIVNTRFYPHSITGVKLASSKGIRPIVIDHGSAYITFGNPVLDIFARAWEHLFTAILKRYPADYYSVSKKGLDWLRTFNIMGAGVLNNSIDAYAFASQSSQRSFRSDLALPEEAFLVTYTGRLIPEKGLKPLLAAAKMLEVYEDIMFLFAGDGPLRSLVESDGKNVVFLGRISSPEIATLLKESDAFCLPSRSEGFSTSLLEAAACATPIISTDVGGAREIVPSEDFGVIIPDTEPETIKDALLSYYHARNTAREKGIRAQELIANEFSWKGTADKVVEACWNAQSEERD
ncbi:MAG: glycosyltransferase family 4 protein [Coriobacteriia bacterium]|nr:glycosyltransferase family 4 protein [Coriobacteriia bacterium]